MRAPEPGEGTEDDLDLVAPNVIDPLMRPEEVAEILRVSVDWVYRAARDGQLRSVRLGERVIRFRPEDIRELRDHGLPADG